MVIPSLAVSRKENDGPLHIFLHGLQGTKELFDPLLQEATFQKRAILTLDFPGFGRSWDVASSHSITAYAEVVAEAAECHAGREVIVIGHSLGAMVASRLASARLLNVKAIISLEGNLTLADCGASFEISGMTEEFFCQIKFPQMLEEVAALDVRSASFRLKALRMVRPEALYRAACSIVEESRSEQARRDFEIAGCKKLLLVGQKSAFATRKLDPSVRIIAVPDAGHFILHDNYPFAARSICEFVVEE